MLAFLTFCSHSQAVDISVGFSNEHGRRCSLTQRSVAENTLLETYLSGSYDPQVIPTTSEGLMMSYVEPNAPLVPAMSGPAPSANVSPTASSILHGSTPSPTPLGVGLSQETPNKAILSYSESNCHPMVIGCPQTPRVMSQDDIVSSSWRACVPPSSQSWLWATGAGTCSAFTIPNIKSEEVSYGNVQQIETSSLTGYPLPLYRSPLPMPAQAQGHSLWAGQCIGGRSLNS